MIVIHFLDNNKEVETGDRGSLDVLILRVTEYEVGYGSANVIAFVV